jgi:hypothetical protein
MTTRDRAIADAARTDAKHRAAWTREQHKEAHAAVENRAALRLELDALGIDHYDRQALARIARIGALLIALGLESEPIDQVIEDGPLVKGLQEELESYESGHAELIVERDKLKEELENLRDAARELLDAMEPDESGDGRREESARDALEELL